MKCNLLEVLLILEIQVENLHLKMFPDSTKLQGSFLLSHLTQVILYSVNRVSD